MFASFILGKKKREKESFADWNGTSSMFVEKASDWLQSGPRG